MILVNSAVPDETRVAVVQDGRIVDLQMTVQGHETLVNDIYRGRVVNIETAIGAAFVDFGEGRNGFLHTSDVMSVYGDDDWSVDKLLTTKVSADEWDSGSSQQSVGAEMDESAGGGGEAATPSEGAPRARDRDEEPEPPASNGRGGERGELRRRGRPRRPIGELLDKGDAVVAQVTKDAIGDKGPTLTTYISIPGRYLVLMPLMEKVGVSRKVPDERERKRLRRILESLEIPRGMGVIVRTAGIGCDQGEIERDLRYLLATWDTFEKRLKRGNHPSPLYQESDVAIRTMRDLFSQRTEKVVIDSQEVYDKIVDFTRSVMPEHLDRITLHDNARPLFHAHGVEQDFERIFSKRVELPSGGSIVFDQTEALVAIDVNSGRTREDGADFEDIALKTNLEALTEISRQLRLRDLGGIIVIDFIDMMRGSSRRNVERALREALAHDRARSKIGHISPFGLLEMTRQRLGPGLSSLLYETCGQCRGTGRVRSGSSRVQAILRRVAAAVQQKGFSEIEIRLRPDIHEKVLASGQREIDRLKAQNPQKEVRVSSVSDQTEDCVLRYLRSDGREVRPGGRRRR